MTRILITALFLALWAGIAPTGAVAQCPKVLNSNGMLSQAPTFANCSGNAATLQIQPGTTWTGVVVNWGDGSPEETVGLWAPGYPALSHSYGDATALYEITLTEPASGCVVEARYYVEEPTSASIQIPFGGVTQGCAPQAISFINSSTNVSPSTTFRWNFGDGSPILELDHTNAGATLSHTYESGTVDCETTVVLTAENYCNTLQGGPSLSQYHPILIYDVDQAVIQADATTLCFPQVTTQVRNATIKNCVAQGNNSPRFERWDFGDLNGDGVNEGTGWAPSLTPAASHSLTFPGLGSYTVMLIDSSFCGLDTAYKTIQVINPPVAVLNANNTTICEGSTVHFQQTATGVNQYLWNFGVGNSFIPTNNGNVSFLFQNPGTYLVRSIVVSSLHPTSCRDTASVTITVLPKPAVTMSLSTNSGCGSVPVTGTAFSPTAASYAWSMGVAPYIVSGPTLPQIVFNGMGTYPVSVTVVGTNGCSRSVQQTVLVHNPPVAQFSVGTACAGAGTVFTDQSVVPAGQTITNWSWNFGSAGTSFSQNTSRVFPAAGSYPATLTITTNLCSDAESTTVNVQAMPVLQVNASALSGCAPLEVDFTAAGTGVTQWAWNFGNNTLSSAANPSTVFPGSPTAAVTYPVSVTGTTSGGCSATQSFVVQAQPAAQAVIGGSYVAECAPFEAQLVSLSQGASQVLWSLSDGFTSNAASVAHTFENSTGFLQTAQIQLVALAANGCHDTTSVALQVFPEPNFAFALPAEPACAPLELTLPAIFGPASFAWNLGDGTTSTAEQPVHAWTNEGDEAQSYNVTFTGISPFGCEQSHTATVTVLPQPHAEFTLDVGAGCAPLDLALNNLSTQATTYDILPGNGQWISTGSNGPVQLTYGEAGATDVTYALTLVATHALGCTDTTSQAVTVYAAPDLSFALATEEACSPLEVALPAYPALASVHWDFGDGTTSDAQAPVHAFANDGDVLQSHLITVEGVSSNGCEGTASHWVHVKPQPQVDFTLSATEGCAPLDLVLNDASSNADWYTVTRGNTTVFSGANLATLPLAFPGGQGVQQPVITVTAAHALGCTDARSETVTVFPAAQYAFDLGIDSVCSPLQVVLPAIPNAASVAWDLGDGTVVTNQSPDWTVQNPTMALLERTVTLTATSVHGCTDTHSETVAVKPQPVASFTASTDGGCAPLPVTLTNTSTQADQFDWDYGDGHGLANAGLGVHAYTYPGEGDAASYEVTLTASHHLGCSDSRTEEVLVFPTMQAVPTGPVTGCAPFSGAFTHAGPEASLVQWSFGNGSSAVGSSASTVFSGVPGALVTYPVTLSALSMYGCADDTTFTVTVHPAPVAQLDLSAQAACAGTEVTLENGALYAAQVSVALNGQTLWTPANPTPGTTFSTVFENPTSEPMELTLTQVATTAAGCTATAEVIHTVYPDVAAQFTVPAAACAPAAIAFDNLTVSPDATYAWDFGDGTQSAVAHPTHLFAPSGTSNVEFPVTLVATTVHGCVDSLTQTVSVLGTPTLTLGLDSLVGCYPLTAHFHPTSDGAASLFWNFGNGLTAETPVEPISHTYFNPGATPLVHTAQVTALSADGCAATGSVEVPVSPGIEAAFDVLEAGCSPLEALVANQSFGATAYHWDFGDGTSSTEASPVHTFVNNTTEDATYVIQLVATSALGCTDTTAVGVVVHPMPEAHFLATPDHQIFPDATITLNNLSTASSTALHTWDFGDGGASQQTQPGLYTYGAWGSYTITLTVDNGFCADGATQEVHIHAPAPVAAFTGGGTGCAPLSVAFQNQSEHAVSYLWDFGDGAQSAELNPIHAYEFPGTYHVKLVATGPEGYADEILLSSIVEVLPTPVAAFTYTPDRVVAPDQVVQFISLASDDAQFFLWNFGDGFQSDLMNPEHNYREPGVYDVALTVQNDFGCQSTYAWAQAVEAIPGGFMVFPTAFTPTTGGSTGGAYDPTDLSNDIFHPHHAGIIRYELAVFNKWGELIFRSTDPGIGWDGYVEGSLVRQDVYAWKAEAQFSDGRTVRQAGDVTLIIP